MANKITLTKVCPSPDIGRCEVCRTELATHILSIENVHELRFCKSCWSNLSCICMGDANEESRKKELEVRKALGMI